MLPTTCPGKAQMQQRIIPQNTAKVLGIKIHSEVHPAFIATLKP